MNYRPDELTFEEELETRWKPKLEASHRTIPYRFDASLVELFDVFFAKHNRFPWCRSLLNRLMNNLAEESTHIEKQTDLYPHALRGHAARRFARKRKGWFDLVRFSHLSEGVLFNPHGLTT